MDLNKIDRVTYSNLWLFPTFDQNTIYIYMIYELYSRKFGSATNKGVQNFRRLNKTINYQQLALPFSGMKFVKFPTQAKKKTESRSGPKL